MSMVRKAPYSRFATLRLISKILTGGAGSWVGQDQFTLRRDGRGSGEQHQRPQHVCTETAAGQVRGWVQDATGF